MPVNSKMKGKRYELEIAAYLKKKGYEARRTNQYCGYTGDASDVVGLDGIHIECKFYKSKAFDYEWMAQAVHDAQNDEIPCVFHRCNGKESLVTMRLDDFMEIYKSWQKNITG